MKCRASDFVHVLKFHACEMSNLQVLGGADVARLQARSDRRDRRLAILQEGTDPPSMPGRAHAAEERVLTSLPGAHESLMSA